MEIKWLPYSFFFFLKFILPSNKNEGKSPKENTE